MRMGDFLAMKFSMKQILAGVACFVLGMGLVLAMLQITGFLTLTQRGDTVPNPRPNPDELISALPLSQWHLAGRNPYHTAYTDHFPRVKDGIVNFEDYITAGPVISGNVIFVGVYDSGNDVSYVYEVDPLSRAVVARSQELQGMIVDLIVVPIQVLGIARNQIFAFTTGSDTSWLYWLRESMAPFEQQGYGELEIIDDLAFPQGGVLGPLMTWVENGSSLVLGVGSYIYRVMPTVVGRLYVEWARYEGTDVMAYGLPVVYDGKVFMKEMFSEFRTIDGMDVLFAEDYFLVLNFTSGELISKTKLCSELRVIGGPPPPIGPLCISLDPVNNILWFPSFVSETSESYVYAYDIENDRLSEPYNLTAEGTGYVWHAPAVLTEPVGGVEAGTVFFVAYNGTTGYDSYYAARYDPDANAIEIVRKDDVFVGTEAEDCFGACAQPVLVRDGDGLWLYVADVNATLGGGQYGPQLVRVDAKTWVADGPFDYYRLELPEYKGYVACGYRGYHFGWVAADYAGLLVPLLDATGEQEYASVLIVEDGIWY